MRWDAAGAPVPQPCVGEEMPGARTAAGISPVRGRFCTNSAFCPRSLHRPQHLAGFHRGNGERGPTTGSSSSLVPKNRESLRFTPKTYDWLYKRCFFMLKPPNVASSSLDSGFWAFCSLFPSCSAAPGAGTFPPVPAELVGSGQEQRLRGKPSILGEWGWSRELAGEEGETEGGWGFCVFCRGLSRAQ